MPIIIMNVPNSVGLFTLHIGYSLDLGEKTFPCPLTKSHVCQGMHAPHIQVYLTIADVINVSNGIDAFLYGFIPQIHHIGYVVIGLQALEGLKGLVIIKDDKVGLWGYAG